MGGMAVAYDNETAFADVTEQLCVARGGPRKSMKRQSPPWCPRRVARLTFSQSSGRRRRLEREAGVGNLLAPMRRGAVASCARCRAIIVVTCFSPIEPEHHVI